MKHSFFFKYFVLLFVQVIWVIYSFRFFYVIFRCFREGFSYFSLHFSSDFSFSYNFFFIFSFWHIFFLLHLQCYSAWIPPFPSLSSPLLFFSLSLTLFASVHIFLISSLQLSSCNPAKLMSLFGTTTFIFFFKFYFLNIFYQHWRKFSIPTYVFLPSLFPPFFPLAFIPDFLPFPSIFFQAYMKILQGISHFIQCHSLFLPFSLFLSLSLPSYLSLSFSDC